MQVTALLNAAEAIRSACASVLGYRGANTEQKLRAAQERVCTLQGQVHELGSAAEKLAEQTQKTRNKVQELQKMSQCAAIVFACCSVPELHPLEGAFSYIG